jgi:hypothetical protein
MHIVVTAGAMSGHTSKHCAARHAQHDCCALLTGLSPRRKTCSTFAPVKPPSQLRGAACGTVAALKRPTAAAVAAAELALSIAPTTTECWTDVVMASKHSCRCMALAVYQGNICHID